jgi:glycerophosphoryl diester phosphodiesterase
VTSLTAWTGTAETAVSGELSGRARLTSAEVIPRGYRSVSDMLSTSPFYVAHRGGSKSYPEHTLYAYTESVRRGAGALELSLARTADGVWFGQHDRSLLRTTGVDVVPNTLTWAEVRAIPIRAALTGNGRGKDRLHATFHEIVTPYAESHVWFLDPKYEQQSHRAEFWELVATIPDSHSRVVIKYHHSNTSLGRDAIARGYASWGYYYESELGDLPTTSDAWTILGLEYSASEAAWATIGAVGKPVLGHIAPTRTTTELALSKGASGVMVAGVADAVPQVDTTATLP